MKPFTLLKYSLKYKAKEVVYSILKIIVTH